MARKGSSKGKPDKPPGKPPKPDPGPIPPDPTPLPPDPRNWLSAPAVSDPLVRRAAVAFVGRPGLTGLAKPKPPEPEPPPRRGPLVGGPAWSGHRRRVVPLAFIGRSG